MARGRKRPARSQRRVEPQTVSRESALPTKKRRPPPSPQEADKRRTDRQSASSRSSSPSSDWSSSRERRESKRRRKIAERARASLPDTEPPKRKTEAAKSKKQLRNLKKPKSLKEPPGEVPGNDLTDVHPKKACATANPDTETPGPSTSVQPAPPHSPAPEDTTTSSEPTLPCCIPRCSWRGPDDALPDHVDNEHASMVLCGPIQQLRLPVNDPERGAALTRVVRAFGEMFAVHFRRPPKSNSVLGCVQLLGPPERAIDFMYQMEVCDENGEMADPPLQHCPLIVDVSSSREFEIVDSLQQVCVTGQTDDNFENMPNWGNREVITVEVKISTTLHYVDPDEETARSSPPPELSFMWM